MRAGWLVMGLWGWCVGAAPSRPHILMVVMDDLVPLFPCMRWIGGWQGWHDVGFRSHQIDTPHIDSVARNGLTLSHYYVQDVCSPSRATFMSGMYPLHHGINDWIQGASAIGLPLNLTTLPDRLHAIGYATHAIGKWHCGFFKWDYTPTFRGFDSFLGNILLFTVWSLNHWCGAGFYGGGEDYFTHMAGKYYDMRRDRSWRCGAGCSEVASDVHGQYSTEIFSQEAVKVVNNHNVSQPLFMYLAYQAVHSPAEVPEKYITPYNNRIANKHRRTFAGMLSAADEGIGNVTAALRERGMTDNLITIVTADNGGPIGVVGGDAVGSCNWPLRGGKHSIWEGGTHVTGMISGVGLPSNNGTYAGLMHGADWMPTLLEAAGDDQPPLPYGLDGVSQWKYLREGGCAPNCPRSEVVYGRHDDASFSDIDNAYRQGDMKVIMGGGGLPDEWLTCDKVTVDDSGRVVSRGQGTLLSSRTDTLLLFNVTADPDEKNDLAKTRWDDAVRLNRTLAERLLTGIPQMVPDPSCGSPTHPNDPKVGPVWEPWC